MKSTPSRDALDGMAIDFGGTKIAVARMRSGEIVKREQVATQPERSWQSQLDLLQSMLVSIGLEENEPVAMAVTGRIDEQGNWYAVNTDILGDKSVFPLLDQIQSRLDRSVTLVNDARAATYGEYCFGAGEGANSFGYITVSTGIGGGFVLDGELPRAGDGLIGHVGFSTSRGKGQRCGSGRMATIESIASGRAIAAAAMRIGHPYFDARDIYLRHLKGIGWASTIIKQSTCAIAELCGNLRAILGLDCIAIGGSIGLADGYIDLVRLGLADEPELFRPLLKPACLAQDSALYGALALSVLRDEAK